jgi:predicted nucleotide-binding protein
MKPPRIFISSTIDAKLDDRRREIKQAILSKITDAGFAPQSFFEAGLPVNATWTFENIMEVMQKCHGAVVLGFHRWIAQEKDLVVPLAAEFNHSDGALALSQRLPILIIAEKGIQDRGIFYRADGQVITSMPTDATPEWVNDSNFNLRFNAWRTLVEDRSEVFFGYSSAANETANSILKYLTLDLGVRVKEYVTGFRAGSTILEEIEAASRTCICGIFLFTADDPLANGKNEASPRDNVIFEAGYFMKAKGKERTLIIREEGAKMPADIGGNIYLYLENRSDLTKIKTPLRNFLEERL